MDSKIQQLFQIKFPDAIKKSYEADILWEKEYSTFNKEQAEGSSLVHNSNFFFTVNEAFKKKPWFCTYKINTQKSLAFLYYNSEKSEREIKESVPFTIATKIIKYLGIYLPKETKEHCKTLMKGITDTQTDGETLHVPRLEESLLRKWLTTKRNLQIQCYPY